MKLYTQQFLIILFFIPVWMNAQVFPVQVTPQVLPPYSLKLSEYGTSDSEKLILNLLFTDITESNVQVRLKFFLENNAGLSIQSNDFVTGANPIFLDGGIPLRLTNIDLQAYFSLQNLLGISPQQYNTPLPEGLYNFCFEVYDVFSDRRISRKSCVPVYLVLNDPPFLNLPGRGEQVLLREPQNIIFQWTPRHLNATNVSYEFTLTELWDTQMDPQAAFLAGRPLYQTNTFATTLLYGPAETPLLPDKMYGWRVRALVSDGISETSVFKNNGFSEIYYFTYTGSCAEPESILAEAKNNTTEKIYWQGVDHKLYDIQYRKKTSSASGKKNSSEGNMWFNAGTQNEYTTIYNLKPGTTYEFRVGGQCIENGPYTYSQIYEFTTTLPIDDNDSTYNCGITPEILITNQESIQQLVVNETFTAGDFPVTIKEITQGNDVYTATIPEEPDEDSEENNDSIDEALPSGIQDKTFSGWGYIVVPYLNDTKIKVSFENIKINTDYQLIDGMVETDYDKNWGGLASVNEILDVFEGDNDLRNINLDYDITIDNISIADDGTIEITHPISGAIRREPGGDDVTIMDTNPDGSRDIFHVDADGNIREGGQMAPGGPIRSQNTAGVNSNGEVTELTAKGIKVEFLEYTDYTYGFDRIPNGQETKLGKYYKQIKDTEGNPYNIINKSVGNGDEDIIRAKVTITDNSLSVHDLVIKTIHGEKVDYDVSGNEITLKLKGYYTFEHENIYATIQPKKNKTSKQTVAGVFSQWHLANKDVNVTIIPVNGASLPNSDVLGSQINKIFKQASVTFNVSVAPEMSIAKSQIGVGESGAFSNYTSDQKDIINQFKSSGVTNRKSYYVFVFGDGIRPSRPSVAGFMPLKRQFGFVFSSNLSQKEEGKSSLAGTLAHELGHGAFALQHPFKKLGTTTSGTDWLMDYGNGKRLSHIDWSQIHNPEFRLYLFQDEGDAALTISALTPGWKPFTYTGEGVFVFNDTIPQESNGAVFGILKDGKLYKWESNSSGNLGYRGDYRYNGNKLSGVIQWYDNPSNSFDINSPIQLYWNKGDCTKNEIYKTHWNFIKDHRNLDLNSGADSYGVDDNRTNNISFLSKSGCSSNSSCDNVVIADLQPEIDDLTLISDAINIKTNRTSTEDIIKKINDLNICGIKQLDYKVIKTLATQLVVQSEFDNETKLERALVKLMYSIPKHKNEDFCNTVLFRSNGLMLRDLIKKVTNTAFEGLTEDGTDLYSLNVIASIVSKLLNDDDKKWYMFNSIIQEKYSTLDDPVQVLALQILLKSLKEQSEEEQQIPSVLNFFLDMLKGPIAIPVMENYKVLVDIATLRNAHKEKFAGFTFVDVISLKTRDPNDAEMAKEIVAIDTNETPTSWILPIPKSYINKYDRVLFHNIQEIDLLENFPWFRYVKTKAMTVDTLKNNPQDFFNEFYTQLQYYLRVGQENNSEFWSRIITINCDNIKEAIHHINLNENSQSLGSVNRETRLSFLKAYFSCNESILEDNLTNNIENTDNSLMKMLSSFSPNDEGILDEIERIGITRINSKLIEKHFNEFVMWLSMQILISESGIPLKPMKSINGVSPKNDNYRFELLQLEANIFQRQNLAGNLNGNKITVNGKEMYYNQLVMVHVGGSFNFKGQRYKQGDLLLIPIIQAYAMSETNQTTVIWNSAFLTADVLSVAIPIIGGTVKATFKLGGHYFAKAIMVSDLTASSASALVTALNEDAIDPDLRFRIQMTALATAIPSLLSSVPTDAIRAIKARTDNELNTLSMDRRISTRARDLLQSSYGGGLSTTRIPGVPDELASAFKSDFPNLSRADDLDEDFFNGWIKYRKRHPNAVICH
ncbi:fibronectin type III domain-containing protein [Aquimarina sp. AU119]|uniref:fibronectin type III domain-containing protein n=1 Tax=Aquimarina sp. AU119 TaxID=2108528 RepID=UPI00135BF37B|nr:fibronectin type III domain-containing protein [Aquimarina sp. AU119]